ncbi:acyl carrier protein [Krasilnikovia sp. MM14-A1259]|uniref:acyl carrier protein n=1 Tax=Krasilnikovia sp. MM14-A1259 TaxID=3373539 RepID=UPI0037F8250A
MTAESIASTLTAESIKDELLAFLGERVKTTVEPDQDLFASGLVSSLFAMQLVVHLEEKYDIAIVGPDLKLDSFRTVETMTSLVLRLRESDGDA